MQTNNPILSPLAYPAEPVRWRGHVPLAEAPGGQGSGPQGAAPPAAAAAAPTAPAAAAPGATPTLAQAHVAAAAAMAKDAPAPAAAQTSPEKFSGAGEKGAGSEQKAPASPSVPAPEDKKADAEKAPAKSAAELRIEALEKESATQRSRHLDALLKARGVNPDSFEFAKFKLGAIDPFTEAGEKAVDDFAGKNPTHVTVQPVRKVDDSFLDSYKPDPNKPRVADFVGADAVRRTLGRSI